MIFGKGFEIDTHSAHQAKRVGSGHRTVLHPIIETHHALLEVVFKVRIDDATCRQFLEAGEAKIM